MEKRTDPVKRRHIDGTDTGFLLKNTDPDRAYKWVEEGAKYFSVDYWEELGWEVAEASPDGVTNGGASPSKKRRKRGTPGGQERKEITRHGHVLMSIDRKEAERAEREGWNGQSGQDRCDEIAAKIAGRGYNPLQGMKGNRSPHGTPYTMVHQDVTPQVGVNVRPLSEL